MATIGCHVSYPVGSGTVTRPGLCNSLLENMVHRFWTEIELMMPGRQEFYGCALIGWPLFSPEYQQTQCCFSYDPILFFGFLSFYFWWTDICCCSDPAVQLCRPERNTQPQEHSVRMIAGCWSIKFVYNFNMISCIFGWSKSIFIIGHNPKVGQSFGSSTNAWAFGPRIPCDDLSSLQLGKRHHWCTGYNLFIK